MSQNTLWIRLTASEGAPHRVAHAEFVRPGIKHRVAPVAPSCLHDVFSPAAASFVSKQIQRTNAVRGVLSTPDFEGQIDGMRFCGMSVSLEKRPLLRLGNLGGEPSALFNRKVWAPYPKRHAVTDIAQDSLQDILIPALNLAYTLKHIRSVPDLPAVPVRAGHLRRRVALFDARMDELRSFVMREDGQVPMIMGGQAITQATPVPARGDAARDEMVSYVMRGENDRWSVASVVCDTGFLSHKVIFKPGVALEDVFGPAVGRRLADRLTTGDDEAGVLSEPDFVCCDTAFAAFGLRVLVHSARRPGDRAMIRLRRVYGVPEPLRAVGPWPVHDFPVIGPSPQSLIEHCRSAIDWARILIGVADHAHHLSAEFLDLAAERLSFEVDLVKRNIVTLSAIAA
ncbi:hypothetical protein [Aestuariicoccus sp. MJ-SS9]|uniref:hypothetical protein n=1 Tax=Aestuariicoccus sp. MJ-SS9 TaxID=3079855 RepID=UPI002909C3AA|nr:hypothetical protein [Aestuariicoccus sp. MJ-SS9]MDU8913890.1 hypothetical protein [Aestuariicoccus sp. MJ-SS9]